MSSTPDTLQMTVSQGPDQILGALSARQALDQVAGSTADVVRRATQARVILQTQTAAVTVLRQQARDLTTASARRLAALDALAQQTSDQLVSAQDALQAARAARAARIEAARVAAARRAAQEQARQARNAAERVASRARARAASRLVRTLPPAATGGPACTGASTDGQSNGNLDPASLCPLWRAPGQRLRGDAAAAFERLSRLAVATRGGPLCVTDSYRSYSEQVALYRRKPGLAAVPGTSEHGWGLAVDFCGGIENFGSDAYDWMKANAGQFGWFHPSWAEPSGAKPEPWHWEFGG